MAASSGLIVVGATIMLVVEATDGVRDARAVIEQDNQLRRVKTLLQHDLQGMTAPTLPPLNPSAGQGYFEYIEGPLGPVDAAEFEEFYDIPRLNGPHPYHPREFTPYRGTLIGDIDDVLMFTSRSLEGKFRGHTGSFYGNGNRHNSGEVATASQAEVLWFFRRGRLYRRHLLIIPGLFPIASTYQGWDLSMTQHGGFLQREATPPDVGIDGFVPAHVRSNSLSDLTQRENRFAHQPLTYPYESRFWFFSVIPSIGRAGLPRVAETDARNWIFPMYERYLGDPWIVLPSPLSDGPYDKIIIPDGDPSYPGHVAKYSNPTRVIGSTWGKKRMLHSHRNDFLHNYWSDSVEYDVVLDNVVSFDVKAWDPGAPVFRVMGQTHQAPGGAIDSAVVVPGDIGYIQQGPRGALGRFLANGSSPECELVNFGAYVDLNYMCLAGENSTAEYERALAEFEARQNLPADTLPRPFFAGAGDSKSQLRGTEPGDIKPYRIYPDSFATGYWVNNHIPAVYDTWSTHYELDGIDNDRDGWVDEGRDGIDNDAQHGIDDPGEQEAPPPYPHPLRGIQIKVRVIEPDSRQVREISIVQKLLPE